MTQPKVDPIILKKLYDIRQPMACLWRRTRNEFSLAEPLTTAQQDADSYLVHLPAVYPEWLGSQAFCQTHGSRFAYIVGEMANGIASKEMVIAAAKSRFVTFFGAAGLGPAVIQDNLESIKASLGESYINWGCNLIHSPNEPQLEQAVVDLLIKNEIKRVSASAYMRLTPALVQYACHGLSTDPNGKIVRKSHLFAKISRPEVARFFMEPAPEAILNQLALENKLTATEVLLAKQVPLATDITIEADSGGHTDNGILGAIFPRIQLLGEKIVAQYNYECSFRLGVAGGIGDPHAANAWTK